MCGCEINPVFDYTKLNGDIVFGTKRQIAAYKAWDTIRRQKYDRLSPAQKAWVTRRQI